MSIDKFNSEGYYDPTTYEALTNIYREETVADKKAAYLPLVYICSPYAGDVDHNENWLCILTMYSWVNVQNFGFAEDL